MIKTLLFGAGAGARLYIENQSHQREFIGFIDNDDSKYGDLFAGLPVYSPNKLPELTFDEIVITTQWVNDVKKQLIDKLRVSEHKVVVPLKKDLKKIQPFLDPHTHNLARAMVRGLASLAIRDEIPLSLDFGTLLGIVRNDDILSWDDDVDFALPISASESFRVWLPKALAELDIPPHWYIESLTDQANQKISFLVKWDESKVTTRPFITSISCRETRDGFSYHMPSLGMWSAPEKHFTSFVRYQWKKSLVIVPRDYEEYLTFVYGDWRKEKRDMTFSDYNNINESSFHELQESKLRVERE